VACCGWGHPRSEGRGELLSRLSRRNITINEFRIAGLGPAIGRFLRDFSVLHRHGRRLQRSLRVPARKDRHVETDSVCPLDPDRLCLFGGEFRAHSIPLTAQSGRKFLFHFSAVLPCKWNRLLLKLSAVER